MAANNEFKYLLEFQSVATGNGAKETVDALKKVEAGAQSLTVRQADLRAEFSGVSDRFDATRTAIYDLDAAQTRATKSTQTFTAGATEVKKANANASQSLLLFSQGFEDLQFGIRGVLNNIPGLIISLGGTAGLAGAISIAAVAGSQLFTWLSKTEEKASDVADRMKAIAESIGDAETDRFQKVSDSIERASDNAAALTQNWDATRQAEAAYSTAALTNAEKLAVAQSLIADALGLQVDGFRELEAVAERQRLAREEAAKQALAAEVERKRKADEAVALAAKEVEDEKLRAGAAVNRLADLREELTLLRQKKAALEEVAKTQIPDRSPEDQLAQPKRLLERRNAERELANPAFQSALAGTESRVDKLEELVRKLTDENTGAAARAETALNAARTKAEDVNRSVAVNIDRIEQTLNADDLVARAQTVAKQGETLAAEVTKAFGEVQTNNERGAAAKDSLLQAAADGKITADELQRAGIDIRTLVGLTQSGQASVVGGVQKLIAVQNRFNDIAVGLGGEIGTLKGKVLALEGQLKRLYK